MRAIQLYHLRDGVSDSVTAEQVPKILQDADGLLWVDIESPTPADIAWLADIFLLHPLVQEDMQNQRQRCKLDPYDDYYFFVLRAIDYSADNHDISSQQLSIVLGSRFLITVHQDAITAMQVIHKRWQQTRVAIRTTSYLFYLVSDIVVDSYFPIVDQIGERIDDLDERIMQTPSQQVLREVFGLRRALLEIRKILGPMRDAYNELIREEENTPIVLVEPTRVYLNDVYDHVLRMTDFVDTYRDMLSGTLDAYQSSQSNQLNANMQRLTVAATVLATATLITGFYGMNLRGLMINSPWRYGGLSVLLVLLVITLLEIWLFRRIKWL